MKKTSKKYNSPLCTVLRQNCSEFCVATILFKCVLNHVYAYMYTYICLDLHNSNKDAI